MKFKQTFDPQYGKLVQLSEQVGRITAPNKGPFTFYGTNTYLIGTKTVAILDPGPVIPSHIEAVKRAVGKRFVSHILVTHTHADHSPACAILKEYFKIQTYAEGAHRPSRALNIGEINPLDASADKAFVPDIAIADGTMIKAEGWTVEAVATPGHTANHMTYSLREENSLFCGDHIMAWATSIVAPPDGSMGDFMASLERLMARDETVFYPGHGGRVDYPAKFMRGLKVHRLMREGSILERLKAGDRSIKQMVSIMYRDVNPTLHGAAALSVLAHMEDLVSRNIIKTDGPPSLNGIYHLVV